MKHNIILECSLIGLYWVEEGYEEGGFYLFMQYNFPQLELYTPVNQQLHKNYLSMRSLGTAIKEMVYLNERWALQDGK